MITGHGNDIYDFGDKVIADFSSNIPYRNASGRIAAHLAGSLRLIGNYPDPHARRLTRQIAAHHGIPEASVLVTNGSAEAFYLLAHLFAGRRSAIAFPAFAEYEDACRLHRHDLSFLPLRQLHPDSRFEADAVWFALPNNPDGTTVAPETVESLCRNNPDAFFIVDNAYGELCPQCRPIMPLHKNHANLISVHSLTKTFAIPGLRLGYLVADESVVSRLQLLRTPWTVNVPAQEAGSFVMENYRDLLPDSEALCRESASLQHCLARIPELEVTPSPCNYFLVRLKKGTAAELKTRLIEQHGILIRDASNFRGLTPAHFRLAVQEADKNRMLVNVLREITSEERFLHS